MRRKLKSAYIQKIETVRKFCAGWPLILLIADSRHTTKEVKHYKKVDKYCRTKKGRLDGSYEIYFGHPPRRISLGNK